MRRYCVWSSFVAVIALAGCGGASADDLYKEDSFGNPLLGGSNAGGSVSSGGVLIVRGGAPAVGGAGSSGGGAASTGGAVAVGGLGSGGTAGAPHGGTLSSGGSSLGGAAGKGGAGGVAGKGGNGSGGSTDKTCDQLLMALPDLLGAAQSCTSSSTTACNGFVKNHCGCMVAVNDAGSTAAQAYADSVTSLTSKCGVLCTGVVCATVTAASCVTTGTGSAGHCLGR